MKKRHVPPWAVALLWLLVWQSLSSLAALPLLLPGPADTLKALIGLFGTGDFWRSVSLSLLRMMSGYLLAVAAGAALAVLCACFPAAESFLSPLRSVIRSTPVSSFIILVLLWITTDRVPVFISFLVVLPLIWSHVLQGIRGTSGELLEMARVYAFPRLRTLRHVYLPSILPFLYPACTTGLGFAWKAAIAAEVIAKPALSIGKNLQDAKVYLQTDELFAWTAAVALLSLALERLLGKALGSRAAGAELKS